MIRWISIFMLNIGAISAASILVGCSDADPSNPEKGRSMPERTIQQVQEEHTDEWMTIDGIEGTAVGLFEGKPCIKIFSSKKAEELRGIIPSTVDGYPVIIEETGIFRALDQP